MTKVQDKSRIFSSLWAILNLTFILQIKHWVWHSEALAISSYVVNLSFKGWQWRSQIAFIKKQKLYMNFFVVFLRIMKIWTCLSRLLVCLNPASSTCWFTSWKNGNFYFCCCSHLPTYILCFAEDHRHIVVNSYHIMFLFCVTVSA